MLSFKTGCHETALLQNTHRHEISVLKQCTVCHTPHSSRYDNLLIGDEDSLCATCHPPCMIAGKLPLACRTIRHLSHMRQHSISPLHTVAVSATASTTKMTGMLSAPNSVHSVISTSGQRCRSAGTGISEQSCTSCHDPHAAPYRYTLKQPRESYKGFTPVP